MALLSAAAALRLVDSMAILLSQAYQLARARPASAASPIVRLLVQDQLQPRIETRRRHHCGDRRLPVIDLSVRLAA